MRFVSWNVQGGKHFDAIAEQLSALSPDVVSLQEVKQDDRTNTAAQLGSLLGYGVAYASAFYTERHTPHYSLGNAVLTRPPIDLENHFVLSGLDEYEGSSTTEPRNAAAVRLSESGLYIVSSHLGYSAGFERTDVRDRQTEKFLKAFSGLDPILVGIDANSEPGSNALKLLEAHFINTDDEQADPTWTDTKVEPNTDHRIDYILRSAGIIQNSFEIIPTTASDHSLLMMDFEFKDQ